MNETGTILRTLALVRGLSRGDLAERLDVELWQLDTTLAEAVNLDLGPIAEAFGVPVGALADIGDLLSFLEQELEPSRG